MRRMAAVALPPIIPHMIAAASKLYEPKGSAGVPTPVCDRILPAYPFVIIPMPRAATEECQPAASFLLCRCQ